ncbi:MAG: hypothetical protein WC600_12430 [Desulfobaccales bacterium]
MKKKILITFLCIMALTVLSASGAFAELCLNYANITGAEISFDGADDSIKFPNTGTYDFQITDVHDGTGSALNLFGNIGGTFTIGAISSPVAGLETAPVTGTGTFSIDDGAGFVLSSALEWVSIFTFGTDGGLNAGGVANVTGITYGGVNADLLAFSAFGSAINALTFQFTPAVSLSELVVDGINHTTYSGSACAVPVPPSLVLLGSALLGLVGLRRKSD